ncbi:ATP-dependent nuclease [Methanolapillus ohkumae]|uniref:DNA replication and repair protein RecF n=1 Tax=Methanolapillus ohkumae TaxID=3028298 RepID=A0AA96ZVQ6_9EURY|nr:DNA replication and repair protein RecF [Methanosarcinaceae archaeon Am2]
MQLSKIEIKNFRSIKDLTIIPNPRCQVFVGINESGKSNILKAISLLDNSKNVNHDDIRYEKEDELIDESYICFYFKLNINTAKKNFKDALSKTVGSNAFDSTLIEVIKNQENSIIEIMLNTDTYARRDLKSSETKINYYSTLYNSSYLKNTEGELLKELVLYFYSLLADSVSKYVSENVPEIIYWKYDEKYLLPSSINLSQFEANSSICLPLQSMFYLAGYKNINEALADTRNGRRNALENLLKKVAQKSTKYLNDIWRDYKHIEFSLSMDGDNLNIRIQDEENKYDCDQRSDGFKRFITFLLALSAKVKHGEIQNAIIIVDEPDIGLHISGQKYLTEELIKMSEKNLVFYSTHSIFMIDKSQPNRHFIVEKSKEETIVKQVDKSNITEDEVIFRALGYSVFETLKMNNLIFEGWWDKRVFDIVLSSKDSRIPDNLKEYGRTFANGVSDIAPIAKILELGDRNYFVISDSDKPAKESHKKYEEQQKCLGAWYEYENLVSGMYTLEDFIYPQSFKNSIEYAIKNHPELTEKFDYQTFSTTRFKRLEFIEKWVIKYTKDSKVKKDILAEIKSNLYSNISISDIEDSYYDLLIKLDENIEKYERA